MAEIKENTVMEPANVFFQVVIEIMMEDENSGKLKKAKEVHLVDAETVGHAEQKVAEEMKGTLSEWKIVSVQQSKISIVY